MTNSPKKTIKLIKGNKKQAVDLPCSRLYGGD